ncbi:MAG: radical SAM protein, partial [bacterium]|nr:radical SAM protein [bacterium]
MKISNLTFIVTDACNFNCAYCMQKKEQKTINNRVIEETVDFFYPYFQEKETIRVGFYGGEPLLAYRQIKYAVSRIQALNRQENKKIIFSLTTNGTLLTEEMLDYFEEKRFALTLSFDGLAQEIDRKKGTLEHMVRLVQEIRQHPGIDFEINSVFTPRTIGKFSAAIRFMIEPGGPGITFNLSTMEQWEQSHLEVLERELERLSDYLELYYRETGVIPVTNFRPPATGTTGPGIFRCGAGQ